MSSNSKLKETERTNSVYANDFHSREAMNLFHYAKSLKSIGYQLIYIRSERVHCKKSDGANLNFLIEKKAF